MIAFRDRMARGRTQTGWLDSRHSFSFGSYRDPAQMGLRSLRVINEDRVIPGAGFPAHAHRDMEIISYVLDGKLRHKDSLGTGSVIAPGEVQRMSAGTGITHSEYNESGREPVHFLQIWIIPSATGDPPGYEQKPLDGIDGKLALAAGPAGAGAAVTIRQDALMYVAKLKPGEEISYTPAPGRAQWLQLARGLIGLNGTEMREGDGAAITEETRLAVSAETASEFLLFDLA
jgi:quercetin 2,3-dioxygenase